MEYRVSLGWRIFTVIATAVLAVGGALLIAKSFGESARIPYFTFLLGLALLLIAVFSCLDTLVTKLTLSDEGVTLRKFFYTHSLPLHDIKGFQPGAQNILNIIPREGAGKRIQIAAHFGRQKEIAAWIKRHCADLDALERAQATRDILADETFGHTKEERRIMLLTANRTALTGNIAGFLLSMWALIYPTPYEDVLIALALLPWIAAYILWQFKGLVRFDARRNKGWPSVAALLFVPSAALVIRSMLDYKLYLFDNGWLPLCIMTVLSIVVFLLAGRKAFVQMKKKVLVIVFTIIIAFGYNFGIIMISNCHYDTSAPIRFNVPVTGKSYSTSRNSTTYYLRLSPWGHFTGEKDQSVNKSLYDAVQPGEQVTVNLYEGKWHIAWFTVGR